MEDSQLLFESQARLARRADETRSASRNRFKRGLTAIEVIADWLTVVVAVNGACSAYRFLFDGERLPHPVPAIAYGAFGIGALMVLLLDRDGAYCDGNSLLRIKETERALRVSTLTFLLMLLVSVIAGELSLQWMLLFSLPIVALALTLEKQVLFIVMRTLRAGGIGVHNVLIYGAGESGRRIFSALIRSPKLGLNPVAFVDDDSELEGQRIFESSYKRQHSAEIIAGPISRELIEDLKCALVIVAIPDLSPARFSEAAEAAQAAKARLAFLPRRSSISANRIEYADIDGTLLHVARKTTNDGYYEVVKRSFDLVLSLGLIVLLTPFWILIALLVRLDSPGPVIFRQHRVGKDGRLFGLYKFRSMYCETPIYGDSPKHSSDPRITRMGRFLRQTSLDELPQLLNVMNGEMSLVGPRPEMPFIALQYNAEQRQRLEVSPGITGLWQLSADRAFHIHDNIEYDLYYIRHRSFFMDLAVLLHTSVFAMRGV